ncbi:MAG TPA: Na-translocating system protein MpsC family protein [Solirubrobacterales bacterium]|nr:Na-translocating system protein MpsC family protein [Solirubrobacterales bacterium]
MLDSKPLSGGELNAAVTREVIRVLNESHGRGPKKAFSFHNGNVLTTVLEEVLTPAERRLAADGERDAVLQMRKIHQKSMAPELKKSIEKITGCRVVAFLNDNHIEPDMAVEVFVLDRPLT